MALGINTNVPSLTAQRGLNSSQGMQTSAMQRLTTGLRINSAKDDAAGLAISDRMTSQVRGLNQAARNAADGISFAQVADGALQETTNILQRMRELGVQGANDTNSSDDRAAIDKELTELKAEMTRINDNTRFNGTGVFGGSDLKIQVGENENDTITITALAKVTAVAGSTSADAGALITEVDAVLKEVAGSRATLGAAQNRFESTISNLQNVSENVSASRSRIMDADFAAETSKMSKSQVLQQAGIAMLSQANQSQQGVLSLLR